MAAVEWSIWYCSIAHSFKCSYELHTAQSQIHLGRHDSPKRIPTNICAIQLSLFFVRICKIQAHQTAHRKIHLQFHTDFTIYNFSVSLVSDTARDIESMCSVRYTSHMNAAMDHVVNCIILTRSDTSENDFFSIGNEN